ncbi:MAG TPA: 3-dehydroquinate synthase [Verrucomicrobiales bacterium]|nr:3-dehydroquinate synthase [Verrucomicrobiales bacterium]
MIHYDIALSFEHCVRFTHQVFHPDNTTLSEVLGSQSSSGKVLLCLDSGLSEGQPALLGAIPAWFQERPGLQLVSEPLVLPGGEQAKNDWSLVERLWMQIHRHGLCRHSYLLAVGGGALLDLAGFAAATAHRGIRHVRLPSTTLSQADGGVGVKNGVNRFGRKNWVGVFQVPFAVINDLSLLQSLPPRSCRSGLVEAVKVALIRDAAFFDQIESMAGDLAALRPEAVEQVVRRSAEWHTRHIATGGDPFELGSARPLDFGHWSAHKLEPVTGFRLLHGEAVAVGMAIDVLYSALAGLLPESTALRILELLERLGFRLYDPALEESSQGRLVVLDGLDEFREHLGGALTITLLEDIGRAREVHTMDENLILQSLARLKQRDIEREAARQPVPRDEAGHPA